MIDFQNGIAIYWMRRDMRLHDNHALYQALRSSLPVMPIFILDRQILDDLPSNDARVTFLHHRLGALKKELQDHGSDLRVFYGNPESIFTQLTSDHDVKALYLNRDYEPYAIKRDKTIQSIIEGQGGTYYDFKDHVIREKEEVLSNSDTPYTVFTPYKKKWLALLEQDPIRIYDSSEYFQNFTELRAEKLISLKEMGFKPSEITMPSDSVKQGVIKSYDKTRNFPALTDGTSKLGVHFRFGTISIREKALKALSLNQTYLSELIWRDFYSQILYHFPHVVNDAFRAKYDTIQWRDSKEDLNRWKNGTTGYPIVDAGMRELNATGYMHNRVRMVVASFLTKHLLLNWRHGEAYFAEKLLDFDLASNNGGWQWASGSGTDAAPYFRIFNPTSQLQKFDKDLVYVKKWVPEYGTEDYPEPMIDHKFARERCLQTYKAALS